MKDTGETGNNRVKKYGVTIMFYFHVNTNAPKVN